MSGGIATHSVCALPQGSATTFSPITSLPRVHRALLFVVPIRVRADAVVQHRRDPRAASSLVRQDLLPFGIDAMAEVLHELSARGAARRDAVPEAPLRRRRVSEQCAVELRSRRADRTSIRSARRSQAALRRAEPVTRRGRVGAEATAERDREQPCRVDLDPRLPDHPKRLDAGPRSKRRRIESQHDAQRDRSAH